MRYRLLIAMALLGGLLTIAQAQPPERVYLPAVGQPATPAPPATPSPEPTLTPALPPPDFVSCAVVGDGSRATGYPVAIAGIDKRGETVTLLNQSEEVVDLTGWRMCSVVGGQAHPIGGTLAPGEQRTFPGGGSPIWNNQSSDPGALWNAAGQLVSIWPD